MNDGIKTGQISADAMTNLETKSTGALFNSLRADEPPDGDVQIPLVALEEDFHKIPGQKYAVLSFIDASGYKGLRVSGAISKPMHLIKMRGVFKTIAAAEAHVRTCRKIDSHFDFHIIETHKWSTIGAHMASEQEWEDDTVNNTMQEYFETEDEVISDMAHRVAIAQQSSKDDRDVQQEEDKASDFWETSQKMPQPSSSCSDLFDSANLMPTSLREAAHQAAALHA